MASPGSADGKAIIRSSSNPHLKMMRSLARRKARFAERAFLIEGRRLVEDALSTGVHVRSLLLREDVDRDWARTLAVDPALTHLVESSAFNASSSLEHSQGIAAICQLPEAADADAFAGDAVMVVDQVRDPGNLGTIMRSTAAASITTMLLTPGSVDPYSPKVLRAGMGAHFRLDIGQLDTSWVMRIRASAMTIVVADMNGECAYDEFDWTRPFALVVGGETESLSEVIRRIDTVPVSIPMARNVESLNAGVAASILVFEAMRQRRACANAG